MTTSNAQPGAGGERVAAVSPSARGRLAWVGAWLGALVIGAYLRWSYPELTEFGLDQQAAMQVGHNIRMGWEFPLAGMRLGVGALAGPIEPYLMALPQFVSDSPEATAAFIGLLGLLAGLLFSAGIARWLGRPLGFATLLLFLTGPWTVYYTRKIWTPDTFPIFSALVFVFLALSLAERRRWALPVALFFLGLEVQLHLAAVVLLPTVGLLLVVFYRRLRPLEVLLGAVLFFLALAPYLLHNYRTGFEDLRYLLQASGNAPTYDLLSLEVLQSLVAGSEFPAAIGLAFPDGAGVIAFPAIAYLLVLATWAGIGLAAVRVWRAWRGAAMGTGAVVLAIALIWTVVPVLFNVRHSVPIFFRYQLYLLPVALLFPALALREGAMLVGRLLVGREAGALQKGARVGLGLLLALVTLIGLRGVLELESVHRALLSPGPIQTQGIKDVYSGPPVRDSRLTISRLEAFVRPDRESIVVGNVQRGPLEYLANSRYRLRFSDDPRVLILPTGAATLAILPESARVAQAALAFGATERRDLDLRWPPNDRPARVFEVVPGAAGVPASYSRPEHKQVLANGLELVAYAVENDDGQGFDLTLVWRVVNADWAHKFWLYNSFVNVFALDGKQLAAAGEVELSTSSNWKQDDLLVVPTHVKLDSPASRGLYRLDAGVYVRFPPRTPIAKEVGSVEVVSFGPLRLGKASIGDTKGTPLATFDGGIRLLSAEAKFVDGQARVELTSTWQATSTPERDLTTFAHVYDSAGKLAAQADSPPAAGAYPTSAWLAGEVVSDARVLTLPPNLPPGAYTVKVGLYDSKTVERLTPNPDHGDRSLAVLTFQMRP